MQNINTSFPASFPCRFSSIVISGGAVKALSSIGCVTYLEEVDILKYVINFLGTSAGSILCLFLVLGFSSKEITSFMVNQFQKEEITQLDIEEALMIFEKYGISSGTNLAKFLTAMIKAKLGRTDVTFLELAKASGKNLIVCVANITDEREEFWSVDTTPNMSVTFAIRTSCSLPLIFTPMQYKQKWYVDGGLYNNFPIDYFHTSILKDVIGINILSKSKDKKEITDFFSYINIILSTALKQLLRPYKDDLINNVVTLELHDEAWISLNDMKLSLPKTSLDANVMIGYEQMKKKLQTHCENMATFMTRSLQTTQQH
jgi:predicted acylesterase/phospholipase RssA